MKLRLELHPSAPTDRRWSCLDDDEYDGAPDAGWRARLMGWGATAEEAEKDYKDLLAGWLADDEQQQSSPEDEWMDQMAFERQHSWGKP